MIVKVRHVSGSDFEVEIDADDTIMTLKAIIISTNSDFGDDPDDVKLIYKGKNLADGSQTIQECGFKDGEFMAMMVKTKPTPAPTPATSAAAPAVPPPVPSGQQDMLAAMAQQQQQQQQASGGLLGSPPEGMVTELCSMGFPKEQVLRALQAAFNNPDRAMGFLLDGNIPAPPPEAMGGGQQPVAGMGGGGGWPEGLLGPQLMTKAGMQPTAQALGGAPVVLLYFSAHWCPPCQRFTPMLAQAYNALGAGQSQVQVVFVSSDRDQGSFLNYFSEMPWVALPFGAPQSQMLGTTFSVRGIPSVVALDGSTGRVLDGNARDAIARQNFDLLACCRGWGARNVDPAAPATPKEPVAAPSPAKNPEPEPVAIDDSIAKAALARMDEVDLEVQETFYATLLKVLNNVLQNPAEPKFRSLKMGNAALQTKLFGVADGAAIDLLKLGGFEEKVDAVMGLTGAPDGHCTMVRNVVRQHAEEQKMNQLRKERDAKIAEEAEKDKSRAPERKFGGGEDGRHDIGGGRRRGGGG